MSLLKSQNQCIKAKAKGRNLKAKAITLKAKAKFLNNFCSFVR